MAGGCFIRSFLWWFIWHLLRNVLCTLLLVSKFLFFSFLFVVDIHERRLHCLIVFFFFCSSLFIWINVIVMSVGDDFIGWFLVILQQKYWEIRRTYVHIHIRTHTHTYVNRVNDFQFSQEYRTGHFEIDNIDGIGWTSHLNWSIITHKNVSLFGWLNMEQIQSISIVPKRNTESTFH